MAKYTPPKQPIVMQIFDIACLVVAIFMALAFPLWMGWAAGLWGGVNVTQPFRFVVTPSALQKGRAKELGVLWSAYG